MIYRSSIPILIIFIGYVFVSYYLRSFYGVNMDYNFEKGQILVVELTSTDIIEGEFVDGCKNRINLQNISVYPSQKKIKGVCCYYRSEISSIQVLDANNSSNDSSTLTKPMLNDLNDSVAKVIMMKETEYERLKLLCQDYIYMSQIDSRYFEAIDHLNNCENIGVVCVTASSKKSAQLSLLVVSSWDQVYIFDILLFNQKTFSPELKSILESDAIKKVVHDSRLLVDVLKSYNVKIDNIFDTQVANIMIQKSENGGTLPVHTKSLSECLAHYFNFPNTLLGKAQNSDVHKWGERPMKSSRKYKAAQLGTYLITLKNHLEAKMLKEFYKAVHVYSTSLNECTAIESQKNLKDTKLADILNELNLKELLEVTPILDC